MGVKILKVLNLGMCYFANSHKYTPPKLLHRNRTRERSKHERTEFRNHLFSNLTRERRYNKIKNGEGLLRLLQYYQCEKYIRSHQIHIELPLQPLHTL